MVTCESAWSAEKLLQAIAGRQVKVNIFVDRWKKTGGNERGNFQTFMREWTEAYEVPSPEPSKSDIRKNWYGFEHPVYVGYSNTGRRITNYVDLNHINFIAEGKQSGDLPGNVPETDRENFRQGMAWRNTPKWDRRIREAIEQAKKYARNVPKNHGQPPFIMVVDPGYAVILLRNFGTGDYEPHPSPEEYIFCMDDLKKPEIIELFRAVWLDPYSLDPARHSQKVTDAITGHLVQMIEGLEQDGNDTEEVTGFIARCVLTFYAEDAGYLPRGIFTDLISKYADDSRRLMENIGMLWRAMYSGGTPGTPLEKTRQFQGRIFQNATVPNLEENQIQILLNAAKAQWAEINPALLAKRFETAIKPHERKRMGAYYSPPAYIERIVYYTVMKCLREEWDSVTDEVIEYLHNDRLEDAIESIRDFHARLTRTTILDPASGCGTFLSASLEMLGSLESEVFAALRSLGLTMEEIYSRPLVGPCQLKGIEINRSAVAISEMVVFLTHLQRQQKILGARLPAGPLLPEFDGIEVRDAVLAWDDVIPVVDDQGRPVMKWDGRTYTLNKKGISVPDMKALAPVMEYRNARPADAWPTADYIVGNPPYLGANRIRSVLGDGYANALLKSYPMISDVDYVMFWVARAGMMVRDGQSRGAGFIVTDKVRHPKNRRITESFLHGTPEMMLAMASPSHPWSGANVRVSMMVLTRGNGPGVLLESIDERLESGEYIVKVRTKEGIIHSNLSMDVDASQVKPLMANKSIAGRGAAPGHRGYLVTAVEARSLGLGVTPGLEALIRPIISGQDIMQKQRGYYAVDLYGMDPDAVRTHFPQVYTWLEERVKPQRDAKKERRLNWHLFTNSAPGMRESIAGLNRYIVTSRTSKNHDFVFLDANVIPDTSLIVFGSDDPYMLSVLLSRPHRQWTLAMGGTQGNAAESKVYIHTTVFNTFPFPETTEADRERLRRLGKRYYEIMGDIMTRHPDLTRGKIVSIYSALRDGVPLSSWEESVAKRIKPEELVSVLEEIDNEAMLLYGIPREARDKEIVAALIRLNQERKKEEQSGRIRFIRDPRAGTVRQRHQDN